MIGGGEVRGEKKGIRKEFKNTHCSQKKDTFKRHACILLTRGQHYSQVTTEGFLISKSHVA